MITVIILQDYVLIFNLQKKGEEKIKKIRQVMPHNKQKKKHFLGINISIVYVSVGEWETILYLKSPLYKPVDKWYVKN